MATPSSSVSLFLLLRALCLLPLVAGSAAWGAENDVHARNAPTLRIFVILPPGGTSDILARVLADHLRTKLRRPVIVENHSGGVGRIAVDALKREAPDGTTVLLAPIALPVIAPLLYKDLGYDPARDLAPIAQIATYEFALAVALDHPAHNLHEFVAWTRANPAGATFGTPGAGGLPHLLGAFFAKEANIQLLHVPYRGVVAAEVDLMGMQIAAAVSTLSDFVQLHRAGKLRILATTGVQRSSLTPDIPTFREQGFPSIEATGWLGVFAPARTPQPVIDQLSGAISAALQAPAVRERMVALGLEPTGTTPKELSAIIAADTVYWRRIIKESGFTPE